MVIRALKLEGEREWSPEEAIARLEAAQSALDRLDELEDEKRIGEEPLRRLRDLYRARFRQCVAVIGGEKAPDALQEQRMRFGEVRRDLIQAERAAVLGLRNEGKVSQEVQRQIERDLDLEEARLRYGALLEERHRYSHARVRYGRHGSAIRSARPAWARLEAVGAHDGVLDPLVADRQHVRPVQGEHQEHVRRPLADALDRDQLAHDLLVGQRLEPGDLSSPASTCSASERSATIFARESPAAVRSASGSSARISSGVGGRPPKRSSSRP